MKHHFRGPDTSLGNTKGMVVSFWHVGDVVRKLREQHGLTASSLARKAGISRTVVLGLERCGPEVEDVTPAEWRALDRLAEAFGLNNGAALYKLIPDTKAPRRRSGDLQVEQDTNTVLRFARRK